MFSPEMKVKFFLDTLAYLLLLGSTSDIETRYKQVMHAKREIPVSNCPSELENLLYSTGGGNLADAREENAVFKNMLEELDERAAPYEAKRMVQKRVPSLYEKKNKKGIHGGEWYLVDTDGKFWIGKEQYVIDGNAAQYGSVPTEYGDYYAMDKILYSGGKFYDMNYDEVPVYKCGGFVSCNDMMFGAEN
jgi:hypothetical protein